MDTLLIARLQFATTTSLHFLFVLVTLGLVTLLVYLQTAWFVTRKPAYERLTRFWGTWDISAREQISAAVSGQVGVQQALTSMEKRWAELR